VVWCWRRENDNNGRTVWGMDILGRSVKEINKIVLNEVVWWIMLGRF
jgi:hypothetical protein